MNRTKPGARLSVAAIAVVTVTVCCPALARTRRFAAAGNTDPNHQAPPWYRGEVVVTFDAMPAHMSFDLPCLARMITENGIQYINGWSEAYDSFKKNPKASVEGESYEAMNDTDNKHARYWIESQNDARIVVRHRSAMYHSRKGISFEHLPVITPFGRKGEWTDEWYTIHPDGTHTRKVRVYTHHAAQSQSWVSGSPREYVHELEGMYLWPGRAPGTLVEDHLEKNAITLIKMDGRHRTISFDPYPLKLNAPGSDMWNAYGEFRHANIHVINTKSRYRPWRIGRPNEQGGSAWGGNNLLMTPYRPVHRLTNLVPCFPPGVTRKQGYSVAGLGQVNYWDHWRKTETSITEIWLSGFTDSREPAAELAALARSWQQAPKAALVEHNGATVYGYDTGARAYLLDVKSVKSTRLAHLAVVASPESPVVNPTFLINNWGRKTAELEIDGKAIPRGRDFRMGHYRTYDVEDGREWEDVLIVWAKVKSTKPIRFKIQPRGYRPRSAASRPSATASRSSRNEEAERLYKVARQAERFGQRAAAKSMYDKIARDYGGTDAAGKAAARLEAMGR